MTIDVAPRELTLVDESGHPQARDWFAIGSLGNVVPSDATGRVALPCWPGAEFAVRRAWIEDGGWHSGPEVRTVRGQARVVVPRR